MTPRAKSPFHHRGISPLPSVTVGRFWALAEAAVDAETGSSAPSAHLVARVEQSPRNLQRLQLVHENRR